MGCLLLVIHNGLEHSPRAGCMSRVADLKVLRKGRSACCAMHRRTESSQGQLRGACVTTVRSAAPGIHAATRGVPAGGNRVDGSQDTAHRWQRGRR
jgi:hypothetical protein